MPLRLRIITPERRVYSEDVDMVIAPGVEGQLRILPHHTPLLNALTYGELRVERGDEEESFAISGGFIEVQPNHVIVLANAAEHAEEIDLARAEASLHRAITRINVTKLRRRKGRRRMEVRQAPELER
jgi:F-type H+-transporting ATPase subunit epsilon